MTYSQEDLIVTAAELPDPQDPHAAPAAAADPALATPLPDDDPLRLGTIAYWLGYGGQRQGIVTIIAREGTYLYVQAATDCLTWGEGNKTIRVREKHDRFATTTQRLAAIVLDPFLDQKSV